MTEYADAVHFKGKVVETPMCTLKRGSSLIAKKPANASQRNASETEARQSHICSRKGPCTNDVTQLNQVFALLS